MGSGGGGSNHLSVNPGSGGTSPSQWVAASNSRERLGVTGSYGEGGVADLLEPGVGEVRCTPPSSGSFGCHKTLVIGHASTISSRVRGNRGAGNSLGCTKLTINLTIH